MPFIKYSNASPNAKAIMKGAFESRMSSIGARPHDWQIVEVLPDLCKCIAISNQTRGSGTLRDSGGYRVSGFTKNKIYELEIVWDDVQVYELTTYTVL